MKSCKANDKYYLTCERNWVYFTLICVAGFWGALCATLGVTLPFFAALGAALPPIALHAARKQTLVERLRVE